MTHVASRNYNFRRDWLPIRMEDSSSLLPDVFSVSNDKVEGDLTEWLINNEMYSCHGCPTNERIYCVLKEGKLFRLTFARDLAKHIVNHLGEGYQVGIVPFKVGKSLVSGEKSRSGLYGIVSSRNGMVLRIATNQDIAELLCGDKHRYVSEIWLETQFLKAVT